MNPANKSRIDRTRVNLDDPYQVGYWAAKWCVTESMLHEAVNAVGHEPAALMRYLNVPKHHVAKVRIETGDTMPGIAPDDRSRSRNVQLAQLAVAMTSLPKRG